MHAKIQKRLSSKEQMSSRGSLRTFGAPQFFQSGLLKAEGWALSFAFVVHCLWELKVVDSRATSDSEVKTGAASRPPRRALVSSQSAAFTANCFLETRCGIYVRMYIECNRYTLIRKNEEKAADWRTRCARTANTVSPMHPMRGCNNYCATHSSSRKRQINSLYAHRPDLCQRPGLFRGGQAFGGFPFSLRVVDTFDVTACNRIVCVPFPIFTYRSIRVSSSISEAVERHRG